MHAIQLVDLAAVLAIHGPTLLYRRELVSDEALQAYWIASRSRCDQWHHALADFREAENRQEPSAMLAWWEANEPMLDEVLLSEPLARITGALGTALDHGRGTEEISPITHAVYLNHLEARNRALRVILCGSGIPVAAGLRLNKLRSLAERWTDAFLGHLRVSCGCSIEHYGFEPHRVSAFAEEAAQLPPGTARQTTGWLMSVAMRDAMFRRSAAGSFAAEANRAVGDAMLLCLRPDLFDSVGALKSLWLHRLQRTAEQADRVLDQLAAADLSSGEILGGIEAIRSSSFGRW